MLLSFEKERVDLIATLDTGASHCLFQRSYGEALGLEIERGVRKVFATANSRFEAYGHEATVTTLGIEVYSMIFFFADTEIVKGLQQLTGEALKGLGAVISPPRKRKW